MGLPQLTFELQKAASTVVARTTQSIVGMILKDTKALGVHVIYQENDIPTELGADNVAYIKRALIGHINRPLCIYLAVVDSTSGTVSGGFADLGQYSYDYLVGPPDIASPDTTNLATLVINQRKNRYIGKLVLPNTASDNEGIINFTASNIKVGSTTYDAGDYASRIAGVLAGTPADCSATNAPLPEVTGVDAVEDPDDAIDDGELILVNDGRQVKLSRAVTSLVTQGDKPAALKKIKAVAAVDLIRYYALTTIEDNYLGKCANTYDNKCILLAALRGYLQTLEDGDVLLEKSSSAELDATAIREYLIGQATTAGNTDEVNRIKALDDAEVIREDTGSYVFIRLAGYVLDAMEDFAIILEVSNGLLAA
mgnify:FL=1